MTVYLPCFMPNFVGWPFSLQQLRHSMKRLRIWQYLLLLLSGVPALLFAYLGHFSRLIIDEHCVFHIARSMDAWESILHYYNTHTASFSRSLLHSALAPIDVLATSFMPLAIVALSALSLFCLLSRIVVHLLNGRPNRIALWIISLLVTAAAINAFIEPQTMYWYNSSTGYILPVVLSIMYLALMLELACRERSSRANYLAIVASAAIAFVLGGASEMFVVFEFTYLTLAIAFIVVFLESSIRRRFFALFLAGWLGTTSALLVHLISPGLRTRVANIEAGSTIDPIRTMPRLLERTLHETSQYLTHTESFAGFMLLFGLGLTVTLILYQPTRAPAERRPLNSTPIPIWLCLLVQLCFVPILWTHVSDLPQIAGRFSYGFTTVVAINFLAVALSIFVLMWRKRIDALLRARRNSLMLCSTSVLLCVAALFFMTQLRSIDIKAYTYLLISSLSFLGALALWLSQLVGDWRARRFALPATLSFIILAATTAALAGVSLYGRGWIAPRGIAPIAYIHVSIGLIWGAFIAFLIQRARASSGADQRWITLQGAIGLVLAVTLSVGIALGHAKQIPDFAAFSRDWDARHQQLIQARDSGIRDVDVPPLEYSLGNYLLGKVVSHFIEKRCAQQYYNLDAINIVQS